MTITRADDERMMRTPTNWPLRPLLPIKRPGKGGGGRPELGLIHESTPLLVRVGSVSRMPPPWAEFHALPTRQYASLDALLDDGWIVD